MDDELGQGLELETATPEPAGIGEERSSGDAGHVGVSCIHRGLRELGRLRGGGDGLRGPGCGRAGQSRERRSRHRRPDGAAENAAGEAGGTVGVGDGWSTRGEDDVNLRHITNYLLLVRS